MTPTLTPFHGGVHPPEHKQQSSEAPIRAAGLPPLLRLSLAQSMGAPARPCSPRSSSTRFCRINLHFTKPVK